MEKIYFRERNPQKQGEKGGVTSLFMKIVFYTLSIFLIYNVFKSVDITVKKLGILSQAQVEVDDLRLMNIELILEQKRVESKDYVETEARNRLNYAKDGDILFVIPETILEKNTEKVKSLLSDKSKGERQKTSKEIWFEFFANGV